MKTDMKTDAAAPQALKATEASPAWLSSPTVFAVNREPAHSDHPYHDHMPHAGETSTLRQSLDGAWLVAVAAAEQGEHGFPLNPSGSAVPDFADPDYDDGAFSRIPVPGTLELAGLLRPQYVNQQYPWDGHDAPTAPDTTSTDPRAILPATNHVAVYRRRFDASEAARLALEEGRRVTLTFHGAATAIYVWLNGAFVGYAEDSYTPSEFDVSAALRPEGNTLAVACYELSSAAWLEDQDFWRMHGLFRGVELAAHPAAHVADLHVVADYEHATGEGSLDVAARIEGVEHAARISAVLTDAHGARVWQESYAVADITEEREGRAVVRFAAELAAVSPWSAEAPDLYTLTIAIRGDEGRIVEVVPQRVGFRRFEIVDGVMRLNGERIVFRGANRHEFDARLGRAITEREMVEDLVTCKRNNINAVRTSHYPNQTRWYELCDEYGVYLIDETNLETHGTWSSPGDVLMSSTAVPGSDPAWEDACVDRIASMVARDRNHPSVLVWSLGNESYGGETFRAMYRYAHGADPTRPVHYEGTTWCREFEDATDIESRMYAKPAQIEEYLRSDPAKPYISCEYMHAMGNSVGGLGLYTDLERYERYQGGFIWDFIDQALWQRLDDGTERLTYGGDWDDRPADYEFSGNGLVYADHRPSPKMQEVKRLYAPVVIEPDARGVTVRNGNLFVSTGGDVFTARMLVDGVERWSADHRFDVPAGGERRFDVAFPQALAASAGVEVVYEVSQRLGAATAWAPAGFELAFGQCAVAVSSDVSSDGGASSVSSDGGSRGRVTRGRWNVGVRSAGPRPTEALLSRAQGGLVSLRREGREMVVRCPRLTCFRPLTDNDRGNASGFDRVRWFGAGRYARVAEQRFGTSDSGVEATYVYELAEPNRTRVTVRYAVDAASGRLRLTASYPGGADMPSLPAFGVEWMLPKRYDRLRFYGLGPEETYRDRLLGARLGVFERGAAEDCAPYLVPQETGNHEGVRWAEVLDADGHGMRVSAVGGVQGAFCASLLPYSSMMLEEATHQEELPPVRHTFLRLLAAQMGVGGDDSWGAPVHDAYLLPADRPYTLDVTVELI